MMLFFNSTLNDTKIYITITVDQVGNHIFLIAWFMNQQIINHYKHLSLQENQRK